MTTRKILQISDIHLEHTRDRAEQERCIDAMTRAVVEHGVDVVAICGDLVAPYLPAGRIMVPWERQQLRRLVLDSTHAGAVVVVIPGNHDKPEDAAHLADIPGCHYCATPQTLTIGQLPEIHVVCVPYPRTDWWFDIDTVEPGMRVPEIERMVTEKLRLAAEIRDRRMTPWLVAMYHGAVAGAAIKIGQSQPKISSDPTIPREAFEGFDLALLGHYHLNQDLSLPSGTVIRYAGSPWPHSHTEDDQVGKGPVLWTLTPGQRPVGRTIPMPYQPWTTVDLEWRSGALHWQFTDCALERRFWSARHNPPTVPQLRELEGVVVRVRVHYPSSAADVVDFDFVRTVFEEAGTAQVHVKREPLSDQTAKVAALAKIPAQTPLFEQLALMHEAVGGGPETDDDRAWLRDACNELAEGRSDEPDELAHCGVDRVEQIVVENLNIPRWRGQRVAVDPEALARDFIVFAGDNGSGKTTLVSVLAMVGYGACPLRGDVKVYAGLGHSAIEATLLGGNGRRYRLRLEMGRHLITRGARKGQIGDVEIAAFAWVDGSPVECLDGKISEYKAWVRKTVFGPESHFYTTAFGIQRSADAELGDKIPVSWAKAKGEDRDQYLRYAAGVLGRKRDEAVCIAIAKEAQDQLDVRRADRDRVQAIEDRLAELQADAGAAAVAVDARTRLVCEATAQRDAARAVLEDVERTAEWVEEQRAKLASLRAERATRVAVDERVVLAMRERDQARAGVDSHRREVERCRGILDDARVNAAEPAAQSKLHAEAKRALAEASEAAAEAEARVDRRRVEIRALEARHADWSLRVEALESSRRSKTQEIEQEEERIAHARRAHSNLAAQASAEAAALDAGIAERKATANGLWQKRDTQWCEVERFRAATATARQAVSGAELAAQGAQSAVAAAEATARAADDRVNSARQRAAWLGVVPCKAEGECASCPALTDATASRDSLASLEEAARVAHTAIEAARAKAGEATHRLQGIVAAADVATRTEAEHFAVYDAADKAWSAVYDGLREAEVDATRAKDARTREVARSRDAVDSAEAALRNARKVLDADRVSLDGLRANAPSDPSALRNSIEEGEQALAVATRRVDDARARLAATPDGDASKLEAVHAAAAQLASAEGDLASATEALAAAERKLSAAEWTADTLRSPADIEGDLAGFTDPEDVPAEAIDNARMDLGAAEQVWTEAADQLREAEQVRDRIRWGVEGAEAELAQLASVVAELAALERKADRWRGLRRAIQRLVTLTIDAAGPAICETLNRLLGRVFGDRFRVRLEAETENKTNDNVRRTHEIIVYDARSGEESPLSRLSGGEQAIVRQAVVLGLRTFAREHGQDRWGVLVLDEADGGVRASLLPLWQLMLREAVDSGACAQLLVVPLQDGIEGDTIVDVAALHGVPIQTADKEAA